MPSVAFYVTDSEAPDAGALLACRLAEKAHGQGHRVYIHTEDDAAAANVDGQLWTFRQGSFVPHALATDLTENDPTPVVIGTGTTPPVGHHDVLINLANAVPNFYGQFARVLDIVAPASRDAARTRYRDYQAHGQAPETHRIG